MKIFGICKLQLTNCRYWEYKIRNLCNYKDYLCNYKLFGFVKLASGLSEFNISVISSELDFFVPYIQSCICILYYVRTCLFSLRRRTYKWRKGIFWKPMGRCIAFYPRPNYLAGPFWTISSIKSSRLFKDRWNCSCSCGTHQKNGATLSKFVYNRTSTFYTIFTTEVKLPFSVKIHALLIYNETTRGRVFIFFHGVALAMTND